ncbi:MAG: hypothetical protein AB7F51_05265, partial [Pseudorhodoplanes sp.]
MRLTLSAAALAALFATAAAQAQPSPLVQGRWNVPTAPADSQTVPAKFSERNAYIDSLPTMAAALIWLNDSDRQQIAAALRADNAPVVQAEAAPAEELSGAFELRDLPKAVTDTWPGLAGYSYLRTADRAVIVREPNSVVEGVIPLADATTGSAKEAGAAAPVPGGEAGGIGE